MELTFALKESGSESLYKQLYGELRNAILDGRLRPGEKLPSTRQLSESLGISRTTVAQGYDQLLAEGYLETRRGSGTFVSEQLPDHLLECRSLGSESRIEATHYQLSGYGKRVAQEQEPAPTELEGFINFRYGCPALSMLPWKLWKSLLMKHSQPSLELLDYSDDRSGYSPLRQALARHLSRARAIQCSSDQVIIVNGAQQALDLCARLLITPGDQVIIEEPAYTGARKILFTAGAKLAPVAVDHSGLVTAALPCERDGAYKLAYVTPSHQFPTGAVMSLPRRIELLDWARKHNVLVVEDDYDSEYRYSGRPIPSLQGLDNGGFVIYIGTFSKVLFPALRIAYLIVPKALVRVFSRAKWLADRQCPILEQCVLAEFIADGHLERHIRRMRTYYDGLRTALVLALKKHLGERISILGDSAGLHIMVRLSSSLANDEIIRRCMAEGVIISDARTFYQGSGGVGEFLLGYGNLTVKEIGDGVRRLARAAK